MPADGLTDADTGDILANVALVRRHRPSGRFDAAIDTVVSLNGIAAAHEARAFAVYGVRPAVSVASSVTTNALDRTVSRRSGRTLLTIGRR